MNNVNKQTYVTTSMSMLTFLCGFSTTGLHAKFEIDQESLSGIIAISNALMGRTRSNAVTRGKNPLEKLQNEEDQEAFGIQIGAANSIGEIAGKIFESTGITDVAEKKSLFFERKIKRHARTIETNGIEDISIVLNPHEKKSKEAKQTAKNDKVAVADLAVIDSLADGITTTLTSLDTSLKNFDKISTEEALGGLTNILRAEVETAKVLTSALASDAAAEKERSRAKALCKKLAFATLLIPTIKLIAQRIKKKQREEH